MNETMNLKSQERILKSILFIIPILLMAFCIKSNLKADETSGQILDKLANDTIDDESQRIHEEELARQKHAAELEAEFRAKYSDIRDYVKNGQIFYKRTREMFDKDDLPELYEMLKDDKYAPYWHDVSTVIGFISDDPNSVPFLLDYLQRDDGAKNFSMLGKLWSLAWIGKIGGKEADSILRKAITEEGARELVKDWIADEAWQDKFLKENKDRIIPSIRYNALEGLAFSKSQENHDFLEKLYKEHFDISMDNRAPTDLMSPLVDAMANKAYIADHGIEDYFNIAWHTDNGNIIGPYIQRYSFLRRMMFR